MIHVQVKVLTPEGKIPAFAHACDACADLMAAEQVTLPPGARALVATGISIAIPEGYEGLIRPRSGNAVKQGLTVLNTPGTIDAGYRGEVKVCLHNTSSYTVIVKRFDRIAQLAVRPVPTVVFMETSELPESGDGRGVGGFGSTGR